MMRFRWRRALLVGLLVGILVVLAIPAHWLAMAVGALAGGRVRVADAEGLWYAGNANLFVRMPAQGAWVSLGRIGWQFPGDDAIVVMELDHGQATLRWRNGGVDLQFAGISLPAALVFGVPGSGLPTGTYGGRLMIEHGILHWGRGNQWSGEGAMYWHSAMTSHLDDYPLGDISINWKLDKSLKAEFSGQRASSHSLHGVLAYAIEPGGLNFTGELIFVDMPRERLRLVLERLGRYELLTSGHAYHFRLDN